MKYLLIFFLLNPNGSVEYHDTGEVYKNLRLCELRQQHQMITQPMGGHRQYVCIRVVEA